MGAILRNRYNKRLARCISIGVMTYVMFVILGGTGLIYGLAAPRHAGAKEAADTATCIANLHKIGTALKCFTQDHDGKFPMNTVKVSNCEFYFWMDALNCYISNDTVFQCPKDTTAIPIPIKITATIPTLAGRSSYIMRDYYKYYDASGNRYSGYIFGSTQGSHRDPANTAIIRCSRSLCDSSWKNMTAVTAGPYSYTDYAQVYGDVVPNIVHGKQPCIMPGASAQYLPNLLHRGGTNYLYMDGHIAWLSKAKIEKACFASLMAVPAPPIAF